MLIIDKWRNSHQETYLIERANSVKLRVNYQRKSGDASTFIGNTLFGMAVICLCLDLSLSKFDIMHDRNEICAMLFNLESKFFRSYKYPYFCSKFLIPIDGQFYLIPDPLKLITKFGRHDLVNHDHVEEEFHV